MSLFLNGVETNTVMWNGVETTGVWNGEVVWGSSPVYTLTLQTDGHGTLTANTLTGYPGDTITLTPTYNTYYRFNNYSNTGGSIAGNVFTFGGTDATAQANFKVNAFTASGGWEKGNNVTVTSNRKWVSAAVPAKYATVSYHTSNVPTAWYATSNRWKPTNASAYKITLNPKVNVTGSMPGVGGHANNCNGQAHFVTLLGSTRSNEVSTHYGNGTTPNYVYNKTITNTTTGIDYRISGCIGTIGFWQSSTSNKTGRMQYIAARTSGTWVATGIAP